MCLLHFYCSINIHFKYNIECNNKNTISSNMFAQSKAFISGFDFSLCLFCILLIGTSALSLVEKLLVFTGKRSTGHHNTKLYDIL